MGIASFIAARIVRAKNKWPWPRHPLDDQYGIETSRRVPDSALNYGDNQASQSSVGYAGSQPSIIRTAIRSLPDVSGAVFIDLGCGKGRAMVIATEFPFAQVVGIELSPSITMIARRNMEIIAAAQPERVAGIVLEGDATKPALPAEGMAVLFLYNPFQADLTARLLQNVSAHLKEHPELRLFLISYNPVQYQLMDASPNLTRYYAARLDFAPSELASSPFGNTYDSVIVWQARGQHMAEPLPGFDRAVTITIPNLGADVDA